MGGVSPAEFWPLPDKGVDHTNTRMGPQGGGSRRFQNRVTFPLPVFVFDAPHHIFRFGKQKYPARRDSKVFALAPPFCFSPLSGAFSSISPSRPYRNKKNMSLASCAAIIITPLLLLTEAANRLLASHLVAERKLLRIIASVKNY